MHLEINYLRLLVTMGSNCSRVVVVVVVAVAAVVVDSSYCEQLVAVTSY